MNLDKQFVELEARLRETEEALADPALTRDPRRYGEVSRKHKELSEVVAAFKERNHLASVHAQAKEMLEDGDPDLAEMAREEIDEAAENLEAAEEKLKFLLIPKDPNDYKNTIVEIRAGTGGDEASLFAGDLFRMYNRYAEIRGWRTELISASESDLGGFKEVVFSVIGEGVFSRLKFEGGTHRVQRVPETETQGRIHTSAVTVAVMPEAEEVDVAIAPGDLKFDVFRSSGPGGQSVNTTDSAVRVTHLPTGLVVSCQDEKSQLKNKNKAMKVLRARLYDRMIEEQAAEVSAARRAQVGSGDRSGRIRTYNYPQNRLSDHRINLTLYSLDHVMEGQIDQVVDPLVTYMQAEQLKNLQ